MSLVLSDAADGDMVVIKGRQYRLMGRLQQGWVCREDGVGVTEFFHDWQPIDGIVFVQPTRASKRAEDRQDDMDPLQQDNPDNGLLWRGTVK